MSKITANGLTVIAGELREQRDGAWTGRLEVDDESGRITGPVTLVIGSATFVGTVVSGAVFQGRYVATIVGGAGGLETDLDAKYYYASTRSTAVADVLSGVGESLDTTENDAALLSGTVARWMRVKGKARLALSQVAKEAGAFWRVTRAGGVAFRTEESWTTVTGSFDTIDNDPSDGEVTIAPDDTPLARPGVTIGGHKVAAVHTTFGPAGLRQVITVAGDDGQAVGATSVLAAAMKRASESALIYSQSYPSKLVLQDADGSVHMTPDDERVRGQGLTKIPLVYGLPGCSAQVAPGTKARLAFDCGDASKPYCTGWDEGANALELNLRAVAINFSASGSPDQSYVRGEAWLDYFDSVVALISTAIGGVPVAGAGLKATLDAGITALAPLRLVVLSQIIKGE
jgi:hypothetical protein